ncbi:MAG TPA: sulfite exporter TauE/SafE family protein [Beijerinckiaceae bacterium]|jgi:uncharacterized membrane protein YfcA|nr:sulfite exporter TauE/SafE family protein [Beijerinckiaceae bacterium]
MMASLTLQTLGVVWLGAFLGAVAAGGAGFAFALTASAVWLHALEPVHTTMLVVACGTLLHVTLVWPVRRSIEPARLLPFAIGGLIGIPIGVALLTHVDTRGLKGALGLFLVVYGTYALLAPRLPEIRGGGRAADAAVGFVGGILGGLGGYSGVLPTIWTQLRGWRKDVARGVFQPFILMAHVVTLVLVGIAAMDTGGALMTLAALPALYAGAWIGWRIYGRLDDRRFRQVLAALLVASGLTLVL